MAKRQEIRNKREALNEKVNQELQAEIEDLKKPRTVEEQTRFLAKIKERKQQRPTVESLRSTPLRPGETPGMRSADISRELERLRAYKPWAGQG